MTLLLAHYRNDGWLVAADRRLTSGGQVVDEAANKSTFVTTPNGDRLVSIYTGLARTGSWDTQRFIEGVLSRFSKNDAGGLEEASRILKDSFSSGYQKHPDIRKSADIHLGLTTMILGYDSSGRPLAAKIYVERKSGTVESIAVVDAVSKGYLRVGGGSTWLGDDARHRIRNMSMSASNHEVLHQMVNALRDAAELSEADARRRGQRGAIGMDVSTLEFPRNDTPHASAYNFSGPEFFAPSFVSAELSTTDLTFKPYVDSEIGTPEWSARVQKEVQARNEFEQFIGAVYTDAKI